MGILNTYALAPGANNPGGLISLRAMISGQPLRSHASGLGTFRAATEFVGLDGIAQDMGDDRWEWPFGALLFSEIEVIETTILSGARSGYVTAETRDRYGAWVVRSAVLTLPQELPRQGVKIGGLVFAFSQGVPLP